VQGIGHVRKSGDSMEEGLASKTATSAGLQTYDKNSNTVTHSYGGTVDKGRKKMSCKKKPKGR
jgi:hypothetical protein